MDGGGDADDADEHRYLDRERRTLCRIHELDRGTSLGDRRRCGHGHGGVRNMRDRIGRSHGQIWMGLSCTDRITGLSMCLMS